MVDDDKAGRADAEALDYDELKVDDEKEICNKYNTLCHIIGGLLLAGLVVGIITIGIFSIG